MKKIYLLTKTLLVAALLCVGASNVWADEVNATLDHTASSSRDRNNNITTTVDAEYEHYNNTKAAAWGGWAYAQFSFTIPAGHSIESATLTWATTIGGSVGTDRNNNIYYVNAGTTIDYESLTSSTNLNPDATYITNVVKAGAATAHTGIETDVSSAVRTIAATQGYIIFKWTNNAAGADLHGKASANAPTLVITTTAETLYTATFNANEGAITPSVTVYTDEERTTPIAKDALSANTTYYYRATLAGYNDYEGSFDVATSNPTVNFTMTAKAVYNYSVKAVDGEDNELAVIASGNTYENESVTTSLPWYVLYNGRLYYQNTNSKTTAITSNNQVVKVTYASTETVNVVYYSEGENIAASSASLGNASNGKVGRGVTTKTYTTLGAGKYRINTLFHVGNGTAGNTWGTAYFYKGETEIGTKVLSAKTNSQSFTSDEFSLTENTDLKITYPDGNNSGLDYIYIVQTDKDVTDAIADCKTYETSDAFATYIDGVYTAGSLTTAAEVYAAHTAWQVENGTASKAILDNTVTSTDHWWGTLGDGADYTGAPDTKYLYNTAGSDYNVNQIVYQLPAGVYRTSVWTYSSIEGWRKIYVSKVPAEGAWQDLITPNTSNQGWVELSDEFTLTEPANIAFGLYATAISERVAGFDNWTLTLTGEQVTVSDAGYATYVSSYDLDFTSTSIKAYKVKVTAKGVATLTKVDNVPAGTPVLLYKEGGATEFIPVMTGAAAVTENDLVAGTGAAVATIDGVYTNMILNVVNDKIGFYFAAGQTVATNRAYLHFASTLAPDVESSARGMRMVFAGDITGISEAAATSEVAQKEGKFIENGKLVIVKNGKKYNANGTQVK